MRKLRIAASILFRKEIKEEDIDLEGITKIKKDHVKKASERGLTNLNYFQNYCKPLASKNFL